MMKLLDRDLNAIEDNASLDIWHQRLDHINEKGLQILANKSFIPFAKGMTLNPYDHCLFG